MRNPKPFSRRGVFAAILGSALLAGAAAAVFSQGGAAPPPTMGRRMPVVPRVQMARWSVTSSGPAALGTVLGTYGFVASPQQLESAGSAVGHRATLSSLGTGAQSAPMRVLVIQATPDQLPQIPLPAIAEGPDGEFRVFIS